MSDNESQTTNSKDGAMKKEEFDRVRRELHKLAMDRIQKHDAHMATLPEGIRIGDSFLLKSVYDAMPFTWVAVLEHSRDPNLVYCVMADERDSMVGSHDIVSEYYDGTTDVLRCAHGLWIHRDDMQDAYRCSYLKDGGLAARQMLSDMVRGKTRVFEGQNSWNHCDDDDPDYEDHDDDLRLWNAACEQEIVFGDPKEIERFKIAVHKSMDGDFYDALDDEEE